MTSLIECYRMPVPPGKSNSSSPPAVPRLSTAVKQQDCLVAITGIQPVRTNQPVVFDAGERNLLWSGCLNDLVHALRWNMRSPEVKLT